MSRLDEPHDARCPTFRGADPDDCTCRDSDGHTPRPPAGTLRRRPDADCRPPWKAQHARMHKLWQAAGVTDRGKRLTLTGVILDRTFESSREMTVGQADTVVRYLEDLQLAGRLRTWAVEALAGCAS